MVKKLSLNLNISLGLDPAGLESSDPTDFLHPALKLNTSSTFIWNYVALNISLIRPQNASRVLTESIKYHWMVAMIEFYS